MPRGEQYKIELEKRLCGLEESVKTILNNHLPHIQEDQREMKEEQHAFRLEQKQQYWLVLTTLVSVLAAIAVKALS